MPSLLRSRLCCFYCGARSAHLKDGTTRQFRCDQCEATNHLDKDGNITDVPTTPSQIAPNFTTVTRPRSPPAYHPDDQPFCKTCLKNQHTFTQILADYLPPEDDPRYQEYERSYPEYRKQLERRYPQVCPTCEPKVRDMLRKSAYAAKSDILTKSLARKPAPTAFDSHPILGTMIVVARCVFWTSMLVQAAWHWIGARGKLRRGSELFGVDGVTSNSDGALCVNKGLFGGELDATCSVFLGDVVKWALFAQVAVLWWNPTMNFHRGLLWNRTVGKVDFYGNQSLVLVICSAAYLFLHKTDMEIAPGFTKITHGSVMVLLLLRLAFMGPTIGLAPPPKLSFKGLEAPLVDKESFQYPADNVVSQPSSRGVNTAGAYGRTAQRLSIGNLPRANNRPTATFSPASTSTSLLTPPPESESDGTVEDMDTTPMDWEPAPSQTAQNPAYLLRPRTTTTRRDPNASQPQGLPLAFQPMNSPFFGRLPPAPKSVEHKLRNQARAPPPQFRPASPTRQKNFFQKLRLSDSAAPLQSDVAETDSATDSAQYMKSIPGLKTTRDLQEARWTLKSDLDAAAKGTGLEDLFSTSFKIEDTNTTSVRVRPKHDPPPRLIVAVLRKWPYIIAISLLCGIVGSMIEEKWGIGPHTWMKNRGYMSW